MKQICLAVFVLSAVACAPKPAETATDTATHQMAAVPDRAEVQRGIDSALERFRDGIQSSDTAKMNTVFAADAVVLPPNAPLARGLAAIGQMNAGMLAAFTFTDVKFKTLDLMVTSDYSVETGTYEMTMKPKTGATMKDVGKYLSVWQKQSDGSWKLVRDMWSSDKAMTM